MTNKIAHTKEPFPYEALFIIGLASQPLVKQEIERVYSQNREHYYARYREGSLYDHPYFRLHSTRNFLAIIQLAGIYEEAKQTGNHTHMDTFLRKGYSAVHRYAKRNTDYLFIDMLKAGLRGRTIDEIEEAELVYLLTAILYFFYQAGMTAFDVEVFRESIADYAQAQDSLLRIIDQDYHAVRNYSKEVRQYMQQLNVKDMDYHIGNILERIVDEETVLYGREMGLNVFEMAQEEYLSVRQYAGRMGTNASLINVVTALLKTMGIPETLYSPKLTKKEFEDYFARFVHFARAYNIPESAEYPLQFAFLTVLGLVKEYNYTRDVALKASKEEAMLDYQKWEREKGQEWQILLEKEREATRNQHELEEKLEKSLEKIAALERDVRRAREELEKKTAQDKELVALRNHLFRMQQKETEPPVEPHDAAAMAETLRQYEIVIIGGNENWVSNMKKAFPAFTYIGGNAVNADLSVLDRPGALVFFNTDSNSHSQYERVTKAMNQNANAFYYLSNTTNVDRTVWAMLAAIAA